MSLLLSCPPGQQAILCPRATDDVLPSVLGLLPPGPAWDGAKVAGTVQNTYWRAYSNVLAYLYGRMCDFVDEFFCATVKESRDQWVAEYGLDDPCDPYGYNLCVKVAAEGGATCEYFVGIAAQAGWAISCYDNSKDAEPVAGCFQCGCTPLGPTPLYMPSGSRNGYGEIGACDYGEVVQHPDTQYWETTRTLLASCKVPGSNLGQGPDTDESCCFITGYYDFNPSVVYTAGDFCQAEGNTITFECPRVGVPADTNPMPVPRQTGVFDDSGNYLEWGNAHVWTVTVDIAASQAATPSQPTSADTDPSSQAGCFMAGNIILSDGSIGGTPLCADGTASPQASFALCFLDRIKPAHTQLNLKVIQP